MIVKDKNICCGSPIIKGARILVSIILANVRDEVPFDEICDEYNISKDDIKDCIDYAIIEITK